MNCCAPPPGFEIFGVKQARRDARRYRRRGLTRSARQLVATVTGKGRDVLEIGGGIGAVQLELLASGAERATNVELSPAYEEEATKLLRERGLDARVERLTLDFAKGNATVPAADIVVMNRVVCCYPDMEALVSPAAARARRALALTFPRDSWWTRLGFCCCNVWMRLAGKEFRAFVHQPAAIVAVAESGGLRVVSGHRGLIWQLATLER